MKVWAAAFGAGFIATLLFHQAVIAAFYAAGAIAAAPWDLTSVPPFAVPKVISLAFWGGVWGLPVWYLVRRQAGAAFWLRVVALGAIGPTMVAMLVVFPVKGIAVSATTVVGGLLVNAAWGLGLGIVMRFVFRLRGGG